MKQTGRNQKQIINGLGETMLSRTVLTVFAAGMIAAAGCNTSHEVQVAPVEIKPIHITIDVNVKIDKALDNFFDDIDKAEDQIKN